VIAREVVFVSVSEQDRQRAGMDGSIIRVSGVEPTPKFYDR